LIYNRRLIAVFFVKNFFFLILFFNCVSLVSQNKEILLNKQVYKKNKLLLDSVTPNNKNLKKTTCTYKDSIIRVKILSPKNPFDKKIVDLLLKKYIVNGYYSLAVSDYEKFLKKLTLIYKEKGFPFVQISPKEITIKEHVYIIELDIQKQRQRTIDRLVVKGYKHFPNRFLKAFDFHNHKMTYSDTNVKKISGYLNALPFLEKIINPETLFKKDSTIVYLYYKKKKNNSFDGLLGFGNDKGNSKIKINGFLNVRLNNVLDKGNSLYLKWNNDGEQTSDLKIGTKSFRIFGFPIDNNANFHIVKRDSTNLNISWQEQLQYIVFRRHKISLSYDFEQSSILLKESSDNFKNYSKNLFGLGYQFYKLQDNEEIPFKYGFEIAYKAGSRKANNQNSKQYIYSLDAFNNLFLYKRIVLETNLHFKQLQASDIYQNELFLIGGQDTFRGVKENAILTDQYYIVNNDLKWYTQNSGFLSLIYDYGITYIGIQKNKLYSFGAGYAFKISKNGNIYINYVVSGQKKSLNKGLLGVKLKAKF